MAWLGICYDGPDSEFLPSTIEKHKQWLKGDRIPRIFGKHFIVIYDSNTAREFVKKIKSELEQGKIVVYTIPSILMEFQR